MLLPLRAFAPNVTGFVRKAYQLGVGGASQHLDGECGDAGAGKEDLDDE